MSDIRLEDEIRHALRADGDTLPMTITEAELERRLVLRRHDRRGRQLGITAAAVAVAAVGAAVVLGSGWLRLPAVGVDSTPSPTATVPAPSEDAASLAPTIGPVPTTDPDRPPLGAPDEAVVVRIGSGAAGQAMLEVDLLRDVESIPTVFQAPFPEGRVPSDDPPRVSADGLLAVPLALAADPDQPRGVVVYDLLDTSREPQTFDTDAGIGANGVAWSPDGRLAIVDPTFVTVVRPFEPPDWATVNIPEDLMLPSYGSGQDEAWSSDGRGLEAWRNFIDPPTGILRLDGIFEPELPPLVADPTGNERNFDAQGRALLVGCDTITGDGERRGCRLMVERPGEAATGETWYVVPDFEVIADYRWDATRKHAWILVETAIGRSPGAVELRRGDASGFETIAHMPYLGDPRILGLSGDDGRIAIDLGDGIVQNVDPGTGVWGGIGGVFAGWADQRGTGG